MAAKGKSTRKRWVDPDDAPPLTGLEVNLPDAKWRVGGREVSPTEGKKAFRAALVGKTRINIHLDNDVLAYFRELAGERGYQTLINKALRRDMSSDTVTREFQLMRDEIRQLREELRAYVRQSQVTVTKRFIEELQSPTVPLLASVVSLPDRSRQLGSGAALAGYPRQQLALVG